MDTKKIITQFKREFWENKVGFIYIPLIVTCLCLLISFSGLIYVSVVRDASTQTSSMNFECNDTRCGFQKHEEDVKDFKSQDLIEHITSKPQGFNDLVLSTMYVNCALISVILAFVLSTYVLRCLFDDRKNKEILFWRSMPVSETTNVLVKLGMQLLAAPLIVLLLNVLVSLVVMLVDSVIFASFGVSFGYMLSSVIHGNTYYIPFQIFFENFFGLLMLLPVIGYFLFASAFAKRSPFFVAVLIPVVLIVADVILKKVLNINLGVVDVLALYAQTLANVKYAYMLQHSLELNFSVFIPFVVCVSIGGAFVSGAIWLRNNRYEL